MIRSWKNSKPAAEANDALIRPAMSPEQPRRSRDWRGSFDRLEYKMQTRISTRIVLSLVVTALLFANVIGTSQAQAQNSTDAASSFSSEELGQIVAPIALYPDSLVSQILMASTYPLEVVQADRWTKSNKEIEGKALEQALDNQSWDPSVKSLVNFPDVLDMMSVKLDWTTKLGDAFIGQQAEVLAAVQKLRSKAKESGNLQSNAQQTVVVESSTQTIIIESSSPNIVYVPTYNPVVVYGTWPYPSYPPYYYHPPGYVATAAISFGIGVACGAAWGYAWGDCHWGRGNIDINVNRNVNFNTNIRNTREFNSNRTRNNWQHDGSHRRGVSYRDQRTSERFGRGASRNASRARENFRGRADRDRKNLSRDAGRRTGNARTRRGGDSARRNNSRDRQGLSGSRADRRGKGNSAISRSGSGKSARDSSRRGSSSRAKSSRGSSSRSRSSGSRSRGGGGRRGGRR